MRGDAQIALSMKDEERDLTIEKNVEPLNARLILLCYQEDRSWFLCLDEMNQLKRMSRLLIAEAFNTLLIPCVVKRIALGILCLDKMNKETSERKQTITKPQDETDNGYEYVNSTDNHVRM